MTSFVLLKVGNESDMTKPFGKPSKDTKSFDQRIGMRPKGAYHKSTTTSIQNKINETFTDFQTL